MPNRNAALDDVERKPLKCALRRTSESFVRAGQLVDAAFVKALRTREQAAAEYGVTPSLLGRQIENTDNQHVSFQRLWSMPRAVKAELLLVLADDLQREPDAHVAVDVETTVRIRRTA